MSVYVDDACIPFRGRVMCHMLADTDSELRAMADRIGMQQRWHQGDHFDIDRNMRERAVAHGAREITRREAVIVRRRFREREWSFVAAENAPRLRLGAHR